MEILTKAYNLMTPVVQITVSDVCEMYLDEERKKNRTSSVHIRKAHVENQIIPRIGDRIISDLTRQDLD